MKVLNSSETSINCNQTTQHYIPEDCTLLYFRWWYFWENTEYSDQCAFTEFLLHSVNTSGIISEVLLVKFVWTAEMCSSSDSSSEESSTDEEDCTMEELERKRLHPYRLHPEMWYNDSGEVCFKSLFKQPQWGILLCYLHQNKMQIWELEKQWKVCFGHYYGIVLYHGKFHLD